VSRSLCNVSSTVNIFVSDCSHGMLMKTNASPNSSAGKGRGVTRTTCKSLVLR
jgi:hypothetical protein